MKLRTALLGITAALGSCPLLDAVRLPQAPLCSSADLEPQTTRDALSDQAIVQVVCESGNQVVRDAQGRVYSRRWVERLECDLQDLASDPRSLPVRSCTQRR